MSKENWRIRPGTVHIHVLPPVESAGFDYDHRHELMQVVWNAHGRDDAPRVRRRDVGVAAAATA